MSYDNLLSVQSSQLLVDTIPTSSLISRSIQEQELHLSGVSHHGSFTHIYQVTYDTHIYTGALKVFF